MAGELIHNTQEEENLPSPDFWFVLNEREGGKPMSENYRRFKDTPFPITYRNISLWGGWRQKHLAVSLDLETITEGFKHSGNLIGLMHWQREQRALSYTGAIFSANQGTFYHPESGDPVSLKEVRKQKRQQQRSKTGRFLAKIGL